MISLVNKMEQTHSEPVKEAIMDLLMVASRVMKDIIRIAPIVAGVRRFVLQRSLQTFSH